MGLALAETQIQSYSKYIFNKGGVKVKLLKVFEKVNLVFPLEQRDFLSYFEDTVAELSSMYGEKFIFSDGKYDFTPPESINSEVPVLEYYQKAITENILFLAGAGDEHKSEFMRQAKDAYLKYWSDNAKGKKLRRNGW